MFSLLIFGLLVIIAVSLVRNSHSHRMKVALREERAEARRVEQRREHAQVAEGTAAIAQMSRDKIVRDQGESYAAYARRTHAARRSF